jgi:hypothetical protein
VLFSHAEGFSTMHSCMLNEAIKIHAKLNIAPNSRVIVFRVMIDIKPVHQRKSINMIEHLLCSKAFIHTDIQKFMISLRTQSL